MTSVYLAGPMSGYPEYNFPEFRTAAALLRADGYTVNSPVELDETLDDFDGTGVCPHHHDYYMRRDLPHLLSSDEVVVLPGWFDSKGAVSEVLVAALAGIPVRVHGSKAYLNITVSLMVYRLNVLLLPQEPPKTMTEARKMLWPIDNFEAMLHPQPPASREPQTWEEGLDKVLAEMRAIMIERQDKYGPENITRQGLLGVLTRATDDKIERIKGALNGTVVRGRVVLDSISDGSQADDTFEDGCLDAANYLAPIMLMLKRGWWGLPRKDKP